MNLVQNLKAQLKRYENIESILEKMEKDGNISLLTSTFEAIMNKEIIFAVQELKKLK